MRDAIIALLLMLLVAGVTIVASRTYTNQERIVRLETQTQYDDRIDKLEELCLEK